MDRVRLGTWQEIGARVAAARTAAGLTQQELATRLNLHRSALARIESGQRHLDALELARLADALGRTVDWFISEPPEMIASHRRARSVDASVNHLEDQLEMVARDVTLLVGIGELRPRARAELGTSLSHVRDAERAAGQVRESLEVPEGPLHELQESVERVGLYVFSLDLGPSVIDGGYVRLDSCGVAVVNGRVDPGRRRFNTAHELGHHLLADEYTTDFAIGSTRQERESLIDAFSIHLLMPRMPVSGRWETLHAEGRDDRTALIVIAAEFRVSWSAACSQVRNLELITEHDRRVLDARRPTRADYLELGVRLGEELAPPAVPVAFVRAVLRAYRRYKIGEGRAIELLRGTVSVDELPERDELPLHAFRGEFEDLA